MLKYYIFIACLGALVLGLVVYSFQIAGSPLDQKLKVQDASVMTDFSTISSQVQNIFSTKHVLPQTLAELNTNGNSSQYAKYEYKVTSPSTYDLCATFATDTKTINAPSVNVYSTNDSTHPKGYACISYTLPDYLLTRIVNPTPIYPVSTPAPTNSSQTSVDFLTGACAGQVKDGMCVLNNCSYSFPHDLYVKGSAIESGTTFEDTCSGIQIYEHSCGSSDNGITYGHTVQNFNCPKGCQAGACIR